MSHPQPNNPLHGITLKTIVEDLVARRGWDDLANRINIRCFSHDPSIKSTLKFLRKTEWARTRVEGLYLQDQRQRQRKQERNRQRADRRAQRVVQEAAEPDAAGTEGSDPSLP